MGRAEGVRSGLGAPPRAALQAIRASLRLWRQRNTLWCRLPIVSVPPRKAAS